MQNLDAKARNALKDAQEPRRLRNTIGLREFSCSCCGSLNSGPSKLACLMRSHCTGEKSGAKDLRDSDLATCRSRKLQDGTCVNWVLLRPPDLGRPVCSQNSDVITQLKRADLNLYRSQLLPRPSLGYFLRACNFLVFLVQR
jgi:hypothetical protein